MIIDSSSVIFCIYFRQLEFLRSVVDDAPGTIWGGDWTVVLAKGDGLIALMESPFCCFGWVDFGLVFEFRKRLWYVPG